MSLSISNIQALCFDVDGTLSATDDLWTSRLVKHLSPLAWMFPRRDLNQLARRIILGIETPGNLAYHLLDRFDLDDDMGRLFNFFARHRIERRPKEFWIHNGVKNMLAALSVQFPMAVVSARDEGSTLNFLDRFELTPYFKVVVTSQTCRYTKPYPDPVIFAARQLGVLPEACLMIGDTTVDIKSGRAANAQTVGVLCGFGQEDELCRSGADLILPSVTDLLETMGK